MAKSPTNRLDSLWPNNKSAGGEQLALPDARVFAKKLEPMIRHVGTAIAEHPRTSLSVAATFGAVLGWLIKRK